ncbi:MAG: STAS domain-containing protein [Spirochaetaceae bacterium]|nr:STAS domain-containing protein [Spirochaetaceae bacterium]
MGQPEKHFNLPDLRPAILRAVKNGYGRLDFRKDALSGLTVGIVALPLSMAIAIASGASPAQGIYAATIAGLVASLLGGGRFQISGPSGTLVVVSYSIIAARGLPALAVATFLAGVMLVFFGLSGFGKLIKYIPYPVTTGFTAGIGAVIFSQQVKDFAGLPIDSLPPDFPSQIVSYAGHAGGFNPPALALGIGTLCVLLLARRFAPRFPSAIVGIAAATAAASLLGLPVETIQSRFGGIPSGFPRLAPPAFGFALARDLLPEAFTMAFLVSLESLLSSVVADGMTGDRHDSNMELVAQGAANMVAGFFGGVPVTGAIARTATNIKSGARSPFSGVIHAGTLLLFLLVLAPFAAAIPLASLSAVLMLVAWDMSDLGRVLRLLRCAPKSDAVVLLVTLALALTVGITTAVEAGLVLATFLFLRRMIEVSGLSKDVHEGLEPGAYEPAADESVRSRAKGVEVFEINGPFFFGVADILQDAESEVERPPLVFVLRLRHVPAIDATGLNALSSFALHAKKRGTALVLAEAREQPKAAIAKMGLDVEIGEENIVETFADALARAEAIITARRRSRRREEDPRAEGGRPPRPSRTKL